MICVDIISASLVLVCVHQPDNRIGDAGAGALVEALKHMKALKELNLASKLLMVSIAQVLVVILRFKVDLLLLWLECSS